MKNLRKNETILSLAIMFFGLLALSFVYIGGGEWVAPSKYDTLKNPLKGNEESLKKGKKLYGQQCATCHGIKGKGDGVAGAALTPHPANFTSSKVQSQSDGAIFWKISSGRPPMAAYKDILTSEQRWQLVNYIRTFKKN